MVTEYDDTAWDNPVAMRETSDSFSGPGIIQQASVIWTGAAGNIGIIWCRHHIGKHHNDGKQLKPPISSALVRN